MKTPIQLLLFTSALFSLLTHALAAPGQADATIAFVNVNLVPMDSERIVPRQTVVVRGDRIAEIGPAAGVTLPANTVRIDGAGKYLIPGLGEMHGHNPPLGSSDEYIENVYFLFVANGVTTVRSMLGWPGQLELRESVCCTRSKWGRRR